MKPEYIRIITSELNKLNEDQLYKVLVLVKNTADENAKVVKPSQNSSLLKGVVTVSDKLLLPSSIAATDKVKKALAQLGLVGGYGIISVVGKNSDNSGRVSSYVCFCIPDKVDGLIEIKEVSYRTVTFQLTVSEVNGNKVNSLIAHDTGQLVQALAAVAKKYIS